MKSFSMNVNGHELQYTMQIDHEYWCDMINENIESWKNEIELHKNKSPKADLQFYVITELGGITWVDMETGEELDGCNDDLDWGVLCEQGVNAFIEFYESDMWRK
jgi:hypothetical protein